MGRVDDTTVAWQPSTQIAGAVRQCHRQHSSSMHTNATTLIAGRGSAWYSISHTIRELDPSEWQTNAPHEGNPEKDARTHHIHAM